MPWSLAKDEDNKDRLMTVIYNLLEAIRVCAVFLKPFLPSTSDNILSQLNMNDDRREYKRDNNYKTNSPIPLFQRINKEEKLKEINQK